MTYKFNMRINKGAFFSLLETSEALGSRQNMYRHRLPGFCTVTSLADGVQDQKRHGEQISTKEESVGLKPLNSR